jgi:hypothetical protein
MSFCNCCGCMITFNFTVLNSVTSDPVVGAEVRIYSETTLIIITGMTGSDGKFTLVYSPIGFFMGGGDNYTFFISASDYATFQSITGTLNCGDNFDRTVPLVEVCTTTFTGSFITSCTGTPMVGATITITDNSTAEVYYTGTTDGSGDFSGTWTSLPGAYVTLKGETTDSFSDTLVTAQACEGSAVYTLTPNWFFCDTTRMPSTLPFTYSGLMGSGSGTLTDHGGCFYTGDSSGNTFYLSYATIDLAWSVEVVTYEGGYSSGEGTTSSCSPFHSVFNPASGTVTVG